jgi:hypothetical protein
MFLGNPEPIIPPRHIIPPGVSVISLTSRLENRPHMPSLRAWPTRSVVDKSVYQPTQLTEVNVARLGLEVAKADD